MDLATYRNLVKISAPGWLMGLATYLNHVKISGWFKELATYRDHVKISAPGWSIVLVDYSLFMMQIYLTKVWGLEVTHAAGIVNIWGGICLILPLFLLFLVDAYLGKIKMLVISSIATAVGIGFIAISTPPVFAAFTRGTCNQYEGKCIGHTQKVLFYTGMASAAVGMSGNLVSAQKLLDEKKLLDEQNLVSAQKLLDEQNLVSAQKLLDEQIKKKGITETTRFRVTRFIFVAIPYVIGAVGIPNLGWSLQFGIPGICTLVAMFLFLSGLCSYDNKEPEGSLLTTVCRVFVAAARNRSQPSDDNNKEPTGVTHTGVPPDEIQDMERSQPSDDNNKEPIGVTHTGVPPDETQHKEFTDTRFLGCLHKAAPPIESSKHLKDRWRVCTIKEVEDIKIAVRILTMCPTLIVIGVVASTSNTYFLAQAAKMKIDKIGNWSIPVPTFLLFFHIAKWMFMYLYKNVLETSLKKYAPPTSIGSAMVLSVLCCSTAAAIEKWRRSQENTTLDVSRLDAAAPAPAPSSIDAGPSINAFWLLFQFFLLAGVEELSERGIDAFFSEQATESMRDYLSNITKGLTGLGFMLGVGLIKATGGKEQTRKHWQRADLDGVRLDKYYWFLAILSSANLTVYSFVTFFYRYRQPQAIPKPPAGAAPNAAESSSSCLKLCSCCCARSACNDCHFL